MHGDTRDGCYQPQMQVGWMFSRANKTVTLKARMSRAVFLLKMPAILLIRLPKPLPAGDQTWLGTPPSGCWKSRTTIAS